MEKIKEGEVEIEVPEGRIYDKDVFYNPKMKFDRNLSVAVASVTKPEKACDALSASGVRGIRYKKEGEVPEVWLNDANEQAANLIQKNLKINNLNCETRKMDAAVLLREEKFDFIDLDPFGSPAEFLDAAASSIRKDGFLSITATDTSSFFGTYPRVSRRRYGRKSMNTDYNKELGLRILVSSIIESLGRYKKTFYPKICYSREHYARIFGEVIKGATEVQENFRNFGHISHCFSCGWRKDMLAEKCPNCGKRTEYVKVYMDKLNNENFCEKTMKEGRKRRFYGEGKFVEKLKNDQEIPYHYDIHYIAKKQGFNLKKMERIIEMLEGQGFKTTRSIYSPTAVKTEAEFKDVVRVFE